MDKNGPSNRPFPRRDSDLFHPDTYADPLEIKPERTALAAIVSIRAYQRARKILLSHRERLSSPPSASITDPNQLLEKYAVIGNAFVGTMVHSLLEDEKEIKRRDPNDKVAREYWRFHDIVAPLVAQGPSHYKEFRIERLGKTIKKPSGVFIDVFNGLEVLPDAIEILLQQAHDGKTAQDEKEPDIPTILAVTRSSYKSQVEDFASMHKDDTEKLGKLDRELKETDPMGISQLQGDTIIFQPEVLEAQSAYRRQVRGKRSRTTRCPFLVPTSEVAAFLDEPAEFDVPMHDAFDLMMDFLEA